MNRKVMDKQVIEKVIDNVLSKQLYVKCSRSYLTGSDKAFIEEFQQHKDEYITGKDTYESHESIQSKIKYTKDESDSVSYWGGGGYMPINSRIYNPTSFESDVKNGFVDKKRVISKDKALQSAIDKSIVPFNVMTERDGHWDKGHKEGDVIVQKGFASTTYNVGLNKSGTDKNHFIITYYVPTGNKGLLLSDNQFDCLYEQELLLGKGTRQYVLHQDDDKQTVDVLVLPDR